MHLWLHSLNFPAWIAETIVAVFFISGVIRHYQEFYEFAFNPKKDRTKRLIARILMPVLTIGVGMLLHFIGYVYPETGMMCHNLGLFLLVFPLLDVGINNFELFVRIAGVAAVWYMHHMMGFTRPQFAISVVLLVIGVVFIRINPARIRDNVWGSLSAFLYLGLTFWLLIPPFTEPSQRVAVITQAVLMYLAFTGIAAYLWDREHKHVQHEADVERLASADLLTNASNYNQYQVDMARMFDQSRATDKKMTMVSIDIDHFKQINDHYGHLAGNSVLIGVATMLNDKLNELPGEHQLYRTGGEEFAISFASRKPSDVLDEMEEIWRDVEKEHFHYGEYDISVTISMGITALRDSDNTIDDLAKRADDNLYLSKHAGRDSITVEGETVHGNGERDLIATYAYFTQPIKPADGKGRYRNELLLRMYDQEHERWVLPEMFDISVQTQIDLMRRTLAQSSTRRIAINLTTEQFSNRDIANALVKFANSKEGPDELGIEITDVPSLKVMRNISAIYRAGQVLVEIDDVGSDNSFEVVNKLLPYADGVKFAMQNLRKSVTEDSMQERIRFWVKVAKEHSLDFVLEGVENKKEVDWAYDELGIQHFQGYYFSKPFLPRL